MPNVNCHVEEAKPAPLQPPVDVKSAQDTHPPSDYANWISDVRAVIIDALQIESEAEALGSEWSSAMDSDTAGIDADEDWYQPPEYVTNDQDEEPHGHQPFLEESRAVLLEVDKIVVGALRVQESAEAALIEALVPDQDAVHDEPAPETPDTTVDATVSAEGASTRDAERTAVPGNASGENELRPDKTATDTEAATPGTPEPSIKRADKRSSGTRRSNKGSR